MQNMQLTCHVCDKIHHCDSRQMLFSLFFRTNIVYTILFVSAGFVKLQMGVFHAPRFSSLSGCLSCFTAKASPGHLVWPLFLGFYVQMLASVCRLSMGRR
jgi:hypothetical protein